MSILGTLKHWFSPTEDVSEELKQFKNVGIDPTRKESEFGEGFENPLMASAGLIAHQFYDKYLYQKLDTKIKKIEEYRRIAANAEISDVIEDAVIEATMPDEEDNIFKLIFKDEKLEKNKNAMKNLQNEFNELVYNRLRLNTKVNNYFEDYLIDGELYLENVIDTNNSKKGILYWKKLPTETMDYIYNYETSQIDAFIQYLKNSVSNIRSIEDARTNKDVILFNINQISYMNYGKFSPVDKTKVFGYLEKARKPFNQLNMLETSVIIYRLVRAPERFVFNIDVGNMPRDKGMQFVEKMKQKLSTKESFDPETGLLKKAVNVMSLSENFFLPTSCITLDTQIQLLDGRIVPLTTVIEEFDSGIKNYVYSVDQKTGKIISGEIEWAGVTRKNAELVRVWLDNDEYIDCTPDHKFVLRDGTEKEAQFLTEGDSLMPLYKQRKKININTNEYEMVYDLSKNDWVYSHRIFVDEPPRGGEVVHHKDFNRFNNNPDNLILMDSKEHIKFHCERNNEMWSDPEFVKFMSEFKTKWWEENEEYKEFLSDLKREWWNDNPEKRFEFAASMHDKWQDPIFREKAMESILKPKSESHKKNLSLSLTELHSSDKGKEIYKEAREKVKEFYKTEEGLEVKENAKKKREEFYKTDEGKRVKIEASRKASKTSTKKTTNDMYMRMVEVFFENNRPDKLPLTRLLEKDIIFMDMWKDANKQNKRVLKDRLSKHVVLSIISNHSSFTSYPDFKENVKYNHKVLKVERLDYREDTGCLTIKDAGENHNFALGVGIFIKNSTGRGSSVSSIGGNPSGFAELDDIYYFQKKLYKALKYPITRVQNTKENRSSESLFGGSSNFGEIPRDELKWSVFLEHQQDKFCRMLLKTFIIHLDFKGFAKQYGLDEHSLSITMNCPNSYKEQIEQKSKETRFNNYNMLVNNQEFSKSYLMKKYLNMSDEDIKLNSEGFAVDRELFGNPDEDGEV